MRRLMSSSDWLSRPSRMVPSTPVTLDALADVVRGVVDGLIDVPSAGLCGQVEHLRIVLDGVADPLLFEGDHLAKEIHLPLLVLGQ